MPDKIIEVLGGGSPHLHLLEASLALNLEILMSRISAQKPISRDRAERITVMLYGIMDAVDSTKRCLFLSEEEAGPCPCETRKTAAPDVNAG